VISLMHCARSARRFSLIRVLKGTGELVYDRSSAVGGEDRSVALSHGLFSSVAQWQSIRLLTGGLLVRVQPEEPTASKSVASTDEVDAVSIRWASTSWRVATRIRSASCGEEPSAARNTCEQFADADALKGDRSLAST
jgi:hypothetical protein